jgi:2-isopropylmalate synthase
VTFDGLKLLVAGGGNGPIDAFVRALQDSRLREKPGVRMPKFDVLNYSEHSLGKGAEAKAVSYIQIKTERGRSFFGAATHTNIELASIHAIVSALNRSLAPA